MICAAQPTRFPDHKPGTPDRPGSCTPFRVETRSTNPDTRWAPFGGSVAPPGAVVFHRYLQQLNNEHRITPTHKPDPSERCPCRPFHRSVEDTFEPSNRNGSDATIGGPPLGDIPPAAPEPQARAVTEIVFQQRTPITGRLIDILA